MTNELYKRYRPKTLKEIVGQPIAVKMISKWFENDNVPHTILIHGPSGTGKTTLARIIRTKLKCHKNDLVEINAADHRGIDLARQIQNQINLAPMSSNCRVWIIDEAHQLTSDAQSAFLKMWEDTPEHVYFILATTDPHKLKPTIRTRCSDIVVKSLGFQDMRELLHHIVRKEDITFDDDVDSAVIDRADGSPRKALVLLDSLLNITDKEEQLKIIEALDEKHSAIEIARVLFKPGTSWKSVAKLLKQTREDPETIRSIILGYANTVLLSGGKMAPRAFEVIAIFSDNFFESKKAGLTAACWESLMRD